MAKIVQFYSCKKVFFFIRTFKKHGKPSARIREHPALKTCNFFFMYNSVVNCCPTGSESTRLVYKYHLILDS
jgi:hypothetical protein